MKDESRGLPFHSHSCFVLVPHKPHSTSRTSSASPFLILRVNISGLVPKKRIIRRHETWRTGKKLEKNKTRCSECSCSCDAYAKRLLCFGFFRLLFDTSPRRHCAPGFAVSPKPVLTDARGIFLPSVLKGKGERAHSVPRHEERQKKMEDGETAPGHVSATPPLFFSSRF